MTSPLLDQQRTPARSPHDPAVLCVSAAERNTEMINRCRYLQSNGFAETSGNTIFHKYHHAKHNHHPRRPPWRHRSVLSISWSRPFQTNIGTCKLLHHIFRTIQNPICQQRPYKQDESPCHRASRPRTNALQAR